MGADSDDDDDDAALLDQLCSSSDDEESDTETEDGITSHQSNGNSFKWLREDDEAEPFDPTVPEFIDPDTKFNLEDFGIDSSSSLLEILYFRQHP